MDNQVYAITNLDGYAEEIRNTAANSISDCKNDNLDEYITIAQTINLVKQKCLGYDNLNRPMLNQLINETIYEDVAIWIHNAGLSKLAAQDYIECAWDENSNEMVFWTKSKPKKKEKKPNAKRIRPRHKNMDDKEQDC